jgi:hypothetical protein
MIITDIKHIARNVKVGWGRKEERNKNLNYGKDRAWLYKKNIIGLTRTEKTTL